MGARNGVEGQGAEVERIGRGVTGEDGSSWKNPNPPAHLWAVGVAWRGAADGCGLFGVRWKEMQRERRGGFGEWGRERGVVVTERTS